METRKLGHTPVMLEEVLKLLQPTPGAKYIDCTIGGGGHTEAILEMTAPDGRVLGIDRDAQALARVEDRLSQQVDSGRLVLVQGNYVELARIAHEAGFVSPQGVLLDLGFSSYVMDHPSGTMRTQGRVRRLAETQNRRRAQYGPVRRSSLVPAPIVHCPPAGRVDPLPWPGPGRLYRYPGLCRPVQSSQELLRYGLLLLSCNRYILRRVWAEAISAPLPA